MPIIKSAIKKMHRDARKTIQNRATESSLRTLLAKSLASKEAETIRQTISALDKAAKKHLIHPNKAGRKKSTLMKLMVMSKEAAPATKKKKKSTK